MVDLDSPDGWARLERRTELTIRALDGEPLTVSEQNELNEINRWIIESLPKPEELPAEIRQLMNDIFNVNDESEY